MSTVSERLRAEMTRRGWSAYRLAQESGVSQQYIGQILKDPAKAANTAGQILEKLAHALGRTVSDLLGDAAAPRGLHRLRERPEWERVAAEVKAESPDLTDNDLATAGQIVDDPATYPGVLDRALVYHLVIAHRDFARRLARGK